MQSKSFWHMDLVFVQYESLRVVLGQIGHACSLGRRICRSSFFGVSNFLETYSSFGDKCFQRRVISSRVYYIDGLDDSYMVCVCMYDVWID